MTSSLTLNTSSNTQREISSSQNLETVETKSCVRKTIDYLSSFGIWQGFRKTQENPTKKTMSLITTNFDKSSTVWKVCTNALHQSGVYLLSELIEKKIVYPIGKNIICLGDYIPESIRPLLNTIQSSIVVPMEVTDAVGLPRIISHPFWEEMALRTLFQEIILKQLPEKALKYYGLENVSQLVNHPAAKVMRITLSSLLFASLHSHQIDCSYVACGLTTFTGGLLYGTFVELADCKGIAEAIGAGLGAMCFHSIQNASLLPLNYAWTVLGM